MPRLHRGGRRFDTYRAHDEQKRAFVRRTRTITTIIIHHPLAVLFEGFLVLVIVLVHGYNYCQELFILFHLFIFVFNHAF